MRAWLSLSVGEFLSLAPEEVAARLAYAQASRHATLELAQRHAWEAEARILRLSKRQAVCEVQLYSLGEEGELVAHVTGTYALPL